MIQFILLLCVALSSLMVASGSWSVDRNSLDHAESAAKLYKGVAIAKALADQNYAMTGRFEGNTGYRTDDQASSSWQQLFPLSVSSAINPPTGAVSPTRQPVLTQISVSPNNAGAASADLFWPANAVYGLVCSTARITGGLDSANFDSCYNQPTTQLHMYLAIAYANPYVQSNGYGDCTAHSDGYLQMLNETLVSYAPKWAAKLGTDVWVRGVDTASPPATLTLNGCPQLWVYLGKNRT